MFSDDRKYIENKYHKTNEPFTPMKEWHITGMILTKRQGWKMRKLCRDLKTFMKA